MKVSIHKMNKKFSAPMTVTNGEIKNSASSDLCGVCDSLKGFSKSVDYSKSRDSVSDTGSNLEIHTGMSCDDPELKVCDSVSNCDNLPANMISKQVDPCEPDSKGSDSLVEDLADTSIENEVEDDFKLALSPEASAADNLSEQNQEDSAVQAIRSSSNISEDMEVDEHKEGPVLSEETDSANLGKKSPDIARLSDVNMGSNINNCAVGEGVACGDSEMIVDKDCAKDACVGNTSNDASGSDVPGSLKEVAKPLKEISECSEVTPVSPSSILAREETGPNSNMENSEEPSTSFTQDQTKVSVQGENTEGCQVSSTTCKGKESSITKDCQEIISNVISSNEKSTNSENDSGPILDQFKDNAEPVLDDIKNSETVLDNVENHADSVLDDVKSSAEPISDNCEFEADLDEYKTNAKHVSDEPVVHAAPAVCTEPAAHTEHAVHAEPAVHTEPVSDKVNKGSEPVSNDFEKIAEPVSGDLNINAEPALHDKCENSQVKESSSKKENVNKEMRKIDGTSKDKIDLEGKKLDVKNKVVLGKNSVINETVRNGTVLECNDVSDKGSNLTRVVSPNMETSNGKIDDIVLSNAKMIDEGNDKRTGISSDKVEEASHNERSTSPPKQTNYGDKSPTINEIGDGSTELSETEEEDALLVSPIKNASVSNESSVSKLPMGMDDEDLLKSPERKKYDEQIVDVEEEAALLNSPDQKVTETKLFEEETEELEDEALLKSPDPKVMNAGKADIEMKEEDWLNSSDSKMTGEISENTSSEEKMEDDQTPNSPNLDIAPLLDIDVPVSKDTSKIDFERDVDTAINKKGDVPIEGTKTTLPACQERDPFKSEAFKEGDSSVEAAASTEIEPVKVGEPMEVEEELGKESEPSHEEGVDNKEEKAELKLELSGPKDCSDTSDVKSTIFSNSSRKDEEGSASMTLSRKRAHSPVADSRESDEKSKFARTVNGFEEESSAAVASPKKEDVATEKKKFELSFDVRDGSVSKIANSDDTDDKKDVPEINVECREAMKSKDESEESQLDPVDLSYLRKLHKGHVEKLSRNDLEELLVQKLCEAITERSEVGDMRLRCQALERGQEKWKEKYSQLQKQVRELNIVIKKFLSEQASMNKDKGNLPTPVRITRSVGLQVALSGSGQRTLAGMRMRAQREAAAVAASSAVSVAVAASSSTVPSASPTASISTSKPANTNSPSVSTAQNAGSTRSVAVTQSSARRLPETPSKVLSPIVQQLPQRQVNWSVSSNATVPLVNTTPPRVNAAPQPSLTLTRPQMSTQVQSQNQTTQISGNIRARSNSTVTMRGPHHQQAHVVHQVQQRPQSTQPASHSSLPQVVMSSNSAPQISRLQVVLAPQQQQQLLQHQQIVLRQPQDVNKDVEIIDLDKDERSRQPTRNAVQQISQVTATPTFPPNGNMTVRLVSNQQSGTTLTSQSHMTLLVPATAQQQKMIITSAPSTVQLNSNQGKSRTNSNVVLKGVVQTMPAQGNAVRQQGVVQQGTIIPSRGLTIVQQPQQGQQQMPQLQQLRPIRMGHPAPLPPAPSVQPDNPNWKMPPPKPSLKIQHTDNGIVLSWNMNLYSSHEDIDSYQLYAYQEGNSPPSSTLWKKVGDVKALPLPMACTLTQFAEGHRYHFAVRAVDNRSRIGPFSSPGNIRLEQKAQ